MADQFRIIPYTVRSAGTDVPPEEVQAGINSLANQTTTALNVLATGESSNVNITGGTIANVSIANSTGVTQSRLDNTTLLATDQFVNQQLASSTATVPFPLSGGIYNQASRGSGASFVIFVSGGVISSILSVVSGGTGYAVGDLLVCVGGNSDGILRVTNVVGGVIQSGGLSVIYGGSGYTTGATVAAIPVPPGQRTVTFTGVLTSNVTFIIQNGTFLTASRRVQFNNNTTGAFTVTVFLSNGLGGTTGSGVVLPQGTNNSTAVIVQTDGMNDVWLSDTPTGIGAAGLASPAFTGTPTAPTAATNTNTTQLATTAFVEGEFANPPAAGFGSTTARPVAATNLSASGTVSGAGFTTLLTNTLASPPAIGGTAANTGAFTTLSATGNFTPSQTNGIVGTTTNNNANAGSVGEIITNTTSGTSLTTGVAANATSISLTAGDWDVSGVVQFSLGAGSTTTVLGAGTNTVSATFGTFQFNSTIAGISAPAAAGSMAFPAPVSRFSLSATTTVFLIGSATFSGGTLTCNGFIRARRVR